MMDQTPFTDYFMHRIEQLSFTSSRMKYGRHEGNASSRQFGGSNQFLSHHRYRPGDDMKSIDWNIYARSDQLHIKQFSKESSSCVYMAIDTSMSMLSAHPSKLEFAKQLAVALGHIALHGRNKIRLVRTQGDYALNPGSSLQSLISFIETVHPDPVDFETLCTRVPIHRNQQNILLCLSDLWEAELLQERFKQLSFAGYHIILIHLLTIEEMHPTFSGALKLVDSESGETIQQFITERDIHQYQQLCESHIQGWQSFAHTRKIHYAVMRTDHTLEHAIFHILRERGVLHA